jgi:hypothetical protein
MVPVSYDLSWSINNVYLKKEFDLPANNTYAVTVKQIPHFYDLEEIFDCSSFEDTRGFIISDPKSGRRAVWETAQLCRWREQRWLSVPVKPGPEEYALIEYEVPSHDRKTDQETTTTYIVGVNPWRAFIAEAVPQAGPPQAPARVEPPDFTPLAKLPADLFPGKTLRLLEQAVWPR